MSNEQVPAEQWAIVELMGHVKLAGRVSVDSTFGAALLRVDVPDSPDIAGFTKCVSPSALYAVTPVSEQIARGLAARLKARPFDTYELADLGRDRNLRLRFNGDPDALDDDDEGPF